MCAKRLQSYLLAVIFLLTVSQMVCEDDDGEVDDRVCDGSTVDPADTEEVHGYHFHVYFYPGVQKSIQEALSLRDAIQDRIRNGFLPECHVKSVNMGPFGPHLVGNYETCCNKTSISPALSFFMQNHGNLSVLFHPLTRCEKMDHTGREMFLGPRIPINTEILSVDLKDNVDTCSTLTQTTKYHIESSTGNSKSSHRRRHTTTTTPAPRPIS